MVFRKFTAALLAFFTLLAPLRADPVVKAHPALWHVKGPEGEVYLLGSIHLLPKNIDWHTPAINEAITRSNVFVFEVSTDDKAQTQIRDLIAKLGTLPAGQSLRASLPPA